MRRTVRTTDGRTLDGQVLGEGFDDLQLRTDDKRVHLLRRAGDRFRAVTSEADWPTYNGDPGGNRYTTLTQIDKTTVARLAPRWLFSIPDAGRLQVTPVVVGGIMYVTAPNQCFALDAGTRPADLALQAAAHQGRLRRAAPTAASAVAGDRVFMETDHAHIIALDRFTGELLWDTELADWRKNYAASSAPLPAGDLVISGVSGGEHGANGFVAAHDQETGKEVWRFWTVPRPGEPGSETWQGKDIEHGGAPTWFTGSYDPALDLVYWPTGNPTKEYNGDDRQGDNLYANSILALDRKTGKRVWHYQFTPHDLWDWDATQTSVLVDAEWQGAAAQADAAREPQRVLLRLRSPGRHAAPGEAVRQEPDLGLRHRRRRPPHQASQPGADRRGHEGLSVAGRRDQLVLAVLQSRDRPLLRADVREVQRLHQERPGAWESGQDLPGRDPAHGDPIPSPSGSCARSTFERARSRGSWRSPVPGMSWGGTLTTATGLVFVAEEGGGLMAVDAESGKPLWRFQTNQTWKASPMTYMFDGRQYVAVAAGPEHHRPRDRGPGLGRSLKLGVRGQGRSLDADSLSQRRAPVWEDWGSALVNNPARR